MSEKSEVPTQFTHDVKIEETAQGIRIHVHVYANDMKEAIAGAFDTYLASKEIAKDQKILMAPMEIKGVKKE